jgi:thioredoxin-like negative regulator of GroEL
MDVHAIAMSGGNLSAEEAADLEERLEQDPHDISTRIKLLGYYFRRVFHDKAARKAKQGHVLWLIENAPESDVLATPFGELNPILDTEAYQKAKKMWEEHIEGDPENLAILRNSAEFLLSHDRPLAEQSLLKAKALDPENPEWPESLGQLYSLYMNTPSKGKREDMAAKALEEYELAYELSTEMCRGYLLEDLAKVAIDAGELEKAEEYAWKMLNSDAQGWNSGNNVYHGNNILGRLALREGDIKSAKEYLIAAGKTSGSPQLDSFGPNMTLAKELLEKGERDSVLKFFDLCSNFWEMDRGRLEEWAKIVEQGGIPDFGANMNY